MVETSGLEPADPLLAKGALRETVTCAFARRRGQAAEVRVVKGTGETGWNAETVHIGYTIRYLSTRHTTHPPSPTKALVDHALAAKIADHNASRSAHVGHPSTVMPSCCPTVCATTVANCFGRHPMRR